MNPVQQWPIPEHPGWRIQVHDMEWGEVFVPTARLVLISERRGQDMPAAIAHASAHLTLGHHEQGGITDADEQWARQMSELAQL